MDILLVSATAFEVEKIFPEIILSANPHGEIIHFTYRTLEVDVLICGPGMVATAFAIGRQLACSKYELAINAGIAGSFNRELEIGEVVQVVSDCIDGLGADSGGKFIPFYSMEVIKAYAPPFISEKGLIRNNFHGELSAVNELKKVSGVTVNTISGTKEKIEELQYRTKADVESMEGAAFFWACNMQNTPCIQLRSISNYVEERNFNNWNLPLAIANLGSTIEMIFKDLG